MSLEERILIIETEMAEKYHMKVSSSEEGDKKLTLQTSPNLEELRQLFVSATQELYDIKVDFEDMQSRYPFPCLNLFHYEDSSIVTHTHHIHNWLWRVPSIEFFWCM